MAKIKSGRLLLPKTFETNAELKLRDPKCVWSHFWSGEKELKTKE
jgi:hypothetical protein